MDSVFLESFSCKRHYEGNNSSVDNDNNNDNDNDNNDTLFFFTFFSHIV